MALPYLGGAAQGAYLLDMWLSLCYNSYMRKKQDGDTSINTRYPQDVLEEMRKLAAQHERSLNGEIVWALREYIKQQKGEQKHEEGI